MLAAAMAMSPVQAQRFDWATGLPTLPRDVAVDSNGNLYFIGCFPNDAVWAGTGELLCSEEVPEWFGQYVSIVKVSPDGELLWKKTISNNHDRVDPHGIKVLGDSCIMVMASVPLAVGYFDLFYLDTLVTGEFNDYPIMWSLTDFMSQTTLAFITLDLDGNLKEHHFIDEVYFDADGNEFWHNAQERFNAISALKSVYLSFDVDNRGYVYICQPAIDICNIYNYDTQQHETHTASDGSIKGIRYWVDRERQIGENFIETPTQNWFSRIVKFSPHFDSVIAVKYDFEASDNSNFERYCSNIELDKDNNLYLVDYLINNNCLHSVNPSPAIIAIDTALGMYMEVKENEMYKGFLIKYNSDLVPQYYIDIQNRPLTDPSDSTLHISTLFYDVAFDYDSNRMFILADMGAGVYNNGEGNYNMLQCQGVDLEGVVDDITFLSFNTETDPPAFVSYGYVPSVIHSSMDQYLVKRKNTIACANNRVIFQYQAFQGLDVPDYPNPPDSILGFDIGHIIFDYQGNYLEEEYYGTSGCPGPTILQDSVLYVFSGELRREAVYGDIPCPYTVGIAKYVDTAFMHPYEAPQVGVPTVAGADTAAVRVWPNPARWTVNISCDEPLRRVEAITLYGHRYPLPFKGYMADISNLPQGLYILEVTTGTNKYHTKIIKK